MAILTLLFGLLSGCLLAVLVGIIAAAGASASGWLSC